MEKIKRFTDSNILKIGLGAGLLINLFINFKLENFHFDASTILFIDISQVVIALLLFHSGFKKVPVKVTNPVMVKFENGLRPQKSKVIALYACLCFIPTVLMYFSPVIPPFGLESLPLYSFTAVIIGLILPLNFISLFLKERRTVFMINIVLVIFCTLLFVISGLFYLRYYFS